MALAEELDITIRATDQEIADLDRAMQGLKRELAAKRQIKADASRLFRSVTGEPHPLEELTSPETRERPREEQVMSVLASANGPVTLSELIEAMPDRPEKGAISAVVHRAVTRGDVRRLGRGVYELAGRYARAS